MLGIALELGGATQVALRQDALGITPRRPRGGEKERLAGEQLLGLEHIGNDLLSRLLGAGGETRQTEGGAGQAQKAPTVEAAVPGRRLARKLTV